MHIARGHNNKVTVCNHSPSVFRSRSVKRHTECLHALVHRRISHTQKIFCTFYVGHIHSIRITDIGQNLVLQRRIEQSEIGNQIGIDLPAILLQLGIGRKESVNVLHELLVSHIERPPKVKQIDVLLNGNLIHSLLGIG